MRFTIICAAVLTLSGMAGHAAAADDAYVTVEGAKQGVLKGQGGDGKFKDKNAAVSITWGVSQQTQAAPTLPAGITRAAVTGRIAAEPLVLTFHLSPFVPQLIQAATTNETIKSVLYEVHRPSPEGDDEITDTIRLTGARIVSVRLIDANGNAQGIDHLVEVAFAYQKLEIENKPGKVMAAFDNSQP